MPLDLSQLLTPWIDVPADQNRPVAGLSLDSRNLKPGDLYICYLTAAEKAPLYAVAAAKRGATGILCDAELISSCVSKIKEQGLNLPVLGLDNLQPVVGFLASKFLDNPSKDLFVTGVTGTNGKTSVSHFVARSLTKLGVNCGVIGTLGNGFPEHLQPSIFTTQLPVELQTTLFSLKNQGARAIAMEVSSHGLDQDRIAGISFDVGVFTNLTRDHLDYHQTMENYAQAKRKLFLQPGLEYAVINADDSFGRQLLKEFSSRLNTIAYSLHDEYHDSPVIRIKNLRFNADGWEGDVVTPVGSGHLKSNLMGEFNVSNLMATLGVLLHKKIPLADALSALESLTTVSGRMQVLGGDNLPVVVVDYSHTPDSLQNALAALRKHCAGDLWCIFGCGGDRDAGKRPIMAQIAEKYADKIIVTNDNPRTEDPTTIIRDICAGFNEKSKIEIEPDRAKAITQAINKATKEDVILVAGKGHEDYQIIGAERLPFSDVEHVAQNLKMRKERSQ